MPAMMVWPVSWLVDTRNVGSSSASFWRAICHLGLVGLGLRLDSNVDDGVGEFHGLENDRRTLAAQRVARGRVLQANDGDDVASGAGIDVDALVGVHLKQAADALFLILGGVGHVGTSVQTRPEYTRR